MTDYKTRNQLLDDATAVAIDAYKHRVQNPLEDMQDRLYMKALPCDQRQAGLAMLAHLGVTFGTDDPEQAVEALGMVLAHAAVLATMERAAIAPIITLAELYRARGDVQPIAAAGAVAKAVIGRMPLAMDREPAPTNYEAARATVDAIALAIAKGLDDVEIAHEVVIKPAELLEVIGRELLEGRGTPSAALERANRETPLPPAPDTERKARAMDQLRDAAARMTEHLEVAEPGDFDAPTTPRVPPEVFAFSQEAEPALHRVMREELAHAEKLAAADAELMASAAGGGPFWGVGKAPVAEGDITGLGAMATVQIPPRHEGAQGLTAHIAASGSGTVIAEISDSVAAAEQALSGPVPGLSSDRVCPQCAASMSSVGVSDMWRCSNGHEHTNKALAAIAGRPLHTPSPIADRAAARKFPPPPKRKT